MTASECAYPHCTRVTRARLCWQHDGRATSLAPIGPSAYGETPVDADDAAALVPGITVTTMADVDDRERMGLAHAQLGLLRRIDEGDAEFLWDDHEFRSAHREAFGLTWTWAGRYRTRETNIGIDPSHIATAIRSLLHDAKAWRQFATYSHLEQAMRFHVEAGRIHPFVNGNGRLSRIYSEAMLYSAEPHIELGWSERQFAEPGARRAAYIAALRQGEATGDFDALMAFAQAE